MATKTAEERIMEHLGAAFNLAIIEIESRARRILRNRPDLHEFVMAKGKWEFTSVINNKHPNTEFPELKAFIDEFNDYLYITGVAMRFTATGPAETGWA